MKRIAALAVSLAVGSSSGWCSTAHAGEPATSPPARAPGPEDDRPLPDYDGRPDPPATAGEILIWVPRILVAPIYVFTEYLARRPWGFGITKFEELRSETSEDESNFGIAPAFVVETDRRPALGLMFAWRKLGSDDNDLRAHIGFGGIDYLRAIGNYRSRLDEDATLVFRAETARLPDQIYWGLGPAAPESRASRYGADLIDGAVRLGMPAWGHLLLAAETGVRVTRFDAPPCCDGPTIGERVLRGQLERPPGFEGATTWRQRLGLGFDTRAAPGERETGLAVGADATHVVDFESADPGRWITWGGAVSGEVDVTGSERMLGLEVAARFADPLAGGTVPFDELASLGGERMRGFLAGRLRDRSATVATLGWRFPLWPYLEAHAEVACGNVWGAHFDGFSVDDLRMTFGGGVRTDYLASEDWLLELLVAAGTERFAEGTEPESLRVLFSLTPRF